MKSPVNSKKLGLALILTAAVAAKGQNVVSWNFDVYGTLSPANTAGAVSAANWNDSYTIDGNALNATENNLMDNSGAATTVSLTELGYNNSWNRYQISTSSPGQDTDGSYTRKLLNGYINKGATETSSGGLTAGHAGVLLSGITYSVYDIYVYFSADTAGRAGTITIGGTTYDYSSLGAAATSGSNASLIQTTDTTGANPGADYAVFTGLTGSSQTIDSYVSQWGGIAGVQIVAEPTPEPGTLALAGLGGALLLRQLRRKANS